MENGGILAAATFFHEPLTKKMKVAKESCAHYKDSLLYIVWQTAFKLC